MIETRTAIILPYHEIESITKEGFTFKTWYDKPMGVSFALCASNFVQEARLVLKKPDIPDQPDNKCVAWRDYAGGPPYFEFPWEKPVIVVFIKSEREWFPQPRNIFTRYFRQRFRSYRNYSDFRKFQMKLNDLGWSTYDLA
jgi:hypothetical protein